MRIALVLMVFAATASPAADDTIKASGKLNGKKVTFPAKSIAAGVKATVGLLESCCDASDASVTYSVADLNKARQKDHIRLEFPKPITVEVLNKKYQVSEVVLTQPLNTGVFWVRCGNRVERFTKFDFKKEKPFGAWRRQARSAE